MPSTAPSAPHTPHTTTVTKASKAAKATRAAQARHDAVACVGDPATSDRVPVLLVPGTGVSPSEAWASTYLQPLTARGHAVCAVALPRFATRDVQTSMEYVATAIRDVAAEAGRPIAVLGQSQGALLPRAALRVWPDLAGLVDDVIGLGGVYDGGSQALVARCRTTCVPALHQLATGSAFLRALHARPLPGGPSYTGIGSLGDLTVTPQPSANQQAGTTAVVVQDVCPGRDIPINDHAMIAGDAVAFALVVDALDHRGTADPERVPGATCDEVYYPEFDQDTYVAAGPKVRKRIADGVATEPAVRCFLRVGCRTKR